MISWKFLYFWSFLLLILDEVELLRDSLKNFEAKSIEPFEENRIQIGDPIGPSEFAGALVMYLDGNYKGPFCTASLITQDSVLTAAHCFSPDFGSPRIQLKFVFGLSDLREPSLLENAGNPKVAITPFDYNKDVNIHEGYVGRGDWFQHDIAIIKLRKAVGSAAPIKLAKLNYLKGIYTVGWGRKNCTHSSIETLRRAKEQAGRKVTGETSVGEVTTKEHCNAMWMGSRGGVAIYDTQMCAYFATSNRQRAAVSAGDSGGPLFKAGPGDKIQIGILSHVMYNGTNYYELGWRCTNPFYPQIFTRVSSYQSWITSLAPKVIFV